MDGRREMKCPHEHTTSGEPRGFTGPVACEPYTGTNPMAHGNVTYVQTCLDCGAERDVNANQGHYEYGTWGPDRRARVRLEREAMRGQARRVLYEQGVVVGAVVGGRAQFAINGVRQVVALEDIEAAAQQPDNGDGLVPFYRALKTVVSA